MRKIKIFIRILAVLTAAMVLITLCACGADSTENSEINNSSETSAETEADAEATAQITETEQPTESNTEYRDMSKISIIVDGKTFEAELYDNDAARELASMLPLTIDMSELNGNEKYYYLPESLPADSSRPGTIHTGDLMLYGNDCIVLFYKNFQTSYSYTPLGRIEDPAGLAETLGNSGVRVTFKF